MSEMEGQDAREILTNAETYGRTAEQLLSSELDIYLKWHEILNYASRRFDAKRQK